MSAQPLVLIGRIGAPHGVRGWVRIKSFTDPPEQLLGYAPWRLVQQDVPLSLELEQVQRSGGHFIAKFSTIDDRDAAEALKGCEVRLHEADLPQPATDEFYWRDLIGCAVTNQTGVEFGRVDHLVETGAHDVLVISDGATERLVPFVERYVLSVDLAQRRIQVEWDAQW